MSLLEKLAALEHEQWMMWASALAASEPNISEDRRKRWARLMVPYEDLPEQVKEDDRQFARKVLRVMNEEVGEVADRLLEGDSVLREHVPEFLKEIGAWFGRG